MRMPQPCFICRCLDDCHHREYDLVLWERAKLAGTPRTAGLYVPPSACLVPMGRKPAARERGPILREIANY